MRKWILLPVLWILLPSLSSAAPGDVDDDGVADQFDNCVAAANPLQVDHDADGFGTACDADFDNDGVVAASDFFSAFRPCLGSDVVQEPDCAPQDLDGDGVVAASDFFAVLRPSLRGPPGPKCAACPVPPDLEPIPDQSLLGDSALHVELPGSDPAGQPVSYQVESDDPLVTPVVIQGNRSLRIVVTGFGEMIFELFENRAPRATEHIIELAESGFYDGVIFHRVAEDQFGDPFVIQGGDPTGTGAGGSMLPPFDDQFDVTLQHNRPGVLSMAKAVDDGNDSQFFITAADPRFLDFNHTIFGQLVSGEAVRAAIQAVPVNASDRPLTPVVMERVEVFDDDQNGVVMLRAAEGASGSATVTVTATDADGLQTLQSFDVVVAPDPVDTPAFLPDLPVPIVETTVDTPVSFQLSAIDLDGGSIGYLDQEILLNFGLPVPVLAPPGLSYDVGFSSGVVDVTPSGGLVGDHQITVATGIDTGAVDYQVVTVRILP